MLKEMKKIGFYGCPPRETLMDACRKYNAAPLDLDGDFNAKDTGLLPATTCQILRNIVNNAVHLRDHLACIVAATGEDKCDGGRFIAWVLADLGIPVITVANNTMQRHPLKISTARMPLRQKMLRIMDTVVEDATEDFPQCQPTVGFWGVLPHDLALLDLFPDTTHVYGWTRCVEAGVPADLELEMQVDPGIPIIFYTQAFCAKQTLARHLAEKHGGLFIDANGAISHSVIAKVEAFLRFGTCL